MIIYGLVEELTACFDVVIGASSSQGCYIIEIGVECLYNGIPDEVGAHMKLYTYMW